MVGDFYEKCEKYFFAVQIQKTEITILQKECKNVFYFEN